MGDKEPGKRDIERRFLATVRSMGKRGMDHPMTPTAIMGGLIGSGVGLAAFDDGIWVLAAIAGAALAIYMKLDK